MTPIFKCIYYGLFNFKLQYNKITKRLVQLILRTQNLKTNNINILFFSFLFQNVWYHETMFTLPGSDTVF